MGEACLSNFDPLLTFRRTERGGSTNFSEVSKKESGVRPGGTTNGGSAEHVLFPACPVSTITVVVARVTPVIGTTVSAGYFRCGNFLLMQCVAQP